MIIDSQNQFSDAQDITASAKSDNIIDLGSFTTVSGVAAERRIGTGENLYIVVQVTTAFTDAGSDSTLTVTLESDDNEGMASPTARQTLGTFAALSAAGTRIIQRIAPEILTEQFIQLDYTVANGNFTTAAVDAFVVHDIDAFTAYPDNILVTGD